MCDSDNKYPYRLIGKAIIKLHTIYILIHINFQIGFPICTQSGEVFHGQYFHTVLFINIDFSVIFITAFLSIFLEKITLGVCQHCYIMAFTTSLSGILFRYQVVPKGP